MPSQHTEPARLSVIIPVGPGDLAWPGLLHSLEGLPASAETIVSACEPRPNNQVSDSLQWLTGDVGRASQLNRGVAAASGDILWLLHADSRPGAEALAHAVNFAQLRSPELAYFDLAFAADGPRLVRLNAIGANLRSRWLGLPFGDQGWLIRREVFDRIGGFDPDFGPGEDLEFVVRARACNVELRRLAVPLETSARRYRERGWLGVTMRHVGLTLQLWRKALKHR